MQTTYILLSFCLGREGPKRGVDIYSQGAAHTCAEPGPLLPLHQHHSAPLRGSGPFACKPGDGSRQHKALVREPVLPQQHISQCLCWCHQIETVRLQVLCGSKTWELTAWNLLKVSPLKHLRINSPFPLPPLFWGWLFGCRVMENTIPASQIICYMTHESASFQSLLMWTITNANHSAVSWFFFFFLR